MNFAISGVAGFVAPRHLKAIKETKNTLVAALDPHDSVGILDNYFPGSSFFTNADDFERYLLGIQENAQDYNSQLHFLSICTPNFLHESYIRMALRIGANAICEKPLSINPQNLYELIEMENRTGRHIYTLLQLRLHPVIQKIKKDFIDINSRSKPEICLTYITRRGRWYQSSWKASYEKSGGLAMNIGIHFFDILLWLYGKFEKNEVHLLGDTRMSGYLELENAKVKWFLSIDERDLPESAIKNGQTSYRSLTINGDDLEFSDGFTDLHTQVYEQVILGNGFRIQDALPSIELVDLINKSVVVWNSQNYHPILLESKND